MRIEKIIESLERINGLANVRLLLPEHKKILLEMEDQNNIGVRECLLRDFTIALTHDSMFREPAGDIVLNTDSGVVLPAVPFPEVEGKDVVSSSPSTNVHKVIVEKLGLDLKDEEATLLIGFNL